MTESHHDQRLEQLIADYLIAQDAGTPLDRAALLESHTDLAEELRAFFREYDRVARLAGPLRAAAGTPPSTEPEPTVGLTASPSNPVERSIDRGAMTQTDATGSALQGLNGSIKTYGARVGYFGDYEIREELGRGGMGIVYRAQQVSLNRLVALKMIKAGILADDAELRRFQNEAEAVALLDHPGIVPIYEVGDHDGHKFFSMKLIAGPSLEKRLSEYRADPAAAALLIATAAEAVHHAHQRGILHRDLKPANILLDERGGPHVTDFGLAKRLEGDNELTLSGAILGTPAYMAPEQASYRKGSVTTATDVYGLGATFYALLTGKAPFHGDSVVETLQQVRERSAESPRRLNRNVPHDLEIICLKCLEKDPLRRYSSAQELAHDLRRYLDGEPIQARPVGAAERMWLWCKRRPALAGLLTALVLALVGVTGLSLAIARREADRAREQATAAQTERSLRDQAVVERDRATRQAYMGTINLAWREWQNGNPARTRALLESVRPSRKEDANLRGFEWFYLDRLLHTDLWTYAPEHTVSPSVAFSPNGTWVAVACDNKLGQTGDIRLLDARDGRELRSIVAQRRFSSRIAVSSDGAYIASASQDRSIVIWDARTGAEVQRLNGHRTDAQVVSFSRDGRLLASLGTTWAPQGEDEIKVWNLAEKREIHSLKIASHVDDVAFSPDGQRVAVASRAGLQLWDLSTGQIVWQTGTREEVNTLAFSPDGRQLAGAGLDGWIALWDAGTGVREGTLSGHRGEIHRLVFSPDGQRLGSAGRDRTVCIWGIHTGDARLELRGHESDVWDLSFSPEGSRLASVSFLDGRVKLWDLGHDQESQSLRSGHPSADGLLPFDLAFSPNGRVLAAAQTPGAFQTWDVTLGSLLFHRDSKVQGGRNSVTISPKADLLATLDEKRSIVLRNPTTGALVRILDDSEASRVARFSPDGQFLAASCEALPTIRIWEVATGHLVGILQGHTQSVQCLAFSPDGGELASGSSDTTVRIWNFPARKERLVYRGHSSAVVCLAYRPEGGGLASASADNRLSGEIHLWDASTGQDLSTPRGHASFVRRVAFLPEGGRLASLGDDGFLKIWDLASGLEALSIPAHPGYGTGLAVSPDGRRIATSAGGGNVRIWDATPVAVSRDRPD